MKRGFLNKSNIKSNRKKLPKPVADDVHKDKCDVEDETPMAKSGKADSKNATRKILNLHKPPESLQVQAGRKRFIFRVWPRNPDGPAIVVTPEGKTASNGLTLWGATLYDFYHVRRLPYSPNGLTISTGSKLAAHMREIGELDWADDEIRWADREENPVEVPPSDIGEVIKDVERHVKWGLYGESMKPAEMHQNTQPSTSSDETDRTLASVFDLSRYPSPWPLIPFSARTHELQKRIPLNLLPKKLVVHDPWDLLFINIYGTGHKDDETMWTTKNEIIRTYNLQLSGSCDETIEKERELGAKESATTNDLDLREGIVYTPSSKEYEPDSPAVIVYPPPRPPPPESIPEAHLYISPVHRAGIGNHSVVYTAEWELPRSLLVGDILCQACLTSKVTEELKAKQQKGEYPHCDVSQVKEGIKIRMAPEGDTQWESASCSVTTDTGSGRIKIIEKHLPARTAEFVSAQDRHAEGNDKGDEATMNEKGGKSSAEIYVVNESQTIRTYEGPLIEIYPQVEWQNPERGPYCSHIPQAPGPIPPTAKVRVVAKLSFEHDRHLEREAKNYQCFPPHLFEHWNGYNVMPPLHDPVPVGAVVPQFYGYYVPEKVEDGTRYLSPILLLEDCGTPIDAEALDKDDRHECASLLYPLHEAGWNHGSFAERNILMQAGPLSQWPAFRGIDGIDSFRLIDFGRSVKCDSKSRREEEATASKLFHFQLY